MLVREETANAEVYRLMHPLRSEELYETAYRRFADFDRAYDGDTLYFDDSLDVYA